MPEGQSVSFEVSSQDSHTNMLSSTTYILVRVSTYKNNIKRKAGWVIIFHCYVTSLSSSWLISHLIPCAASLPCEVTCSQVQLLERGHLWGATILSTTDKICKKINIQDPGNGVFKKHSLPIRQPASVTEKWEIDLGEHTYHLHLFTVWVYSFCS